MPFWVAQTKGSLVDEINAVLAEYRDDADEKKAFAAMLELYRRERGSAGLDSVKLSESSSHNDYMIRIWFPLYINMPWSDGTQSEGNRVARELERKAPGTVYEVQYEY